MKIVAFFLLPFLLFFTACGGGSSSEKETSDSTQFLSIAYAPAASNIPIGIEKIVTITFTAAIDRTTVDDASVYIEDASSRHIPAALIISGDRVSVIPTDYFLESSQYTPVVKSSVSDEIGRSLQDDFTFTFTTSTGPDVTAPLQVSLTPASGSSADKATPVIMTFDEVIADNGATIELKEKVSGTTIDGNTSVHDQGLYFLPDAELTYEVEYTATLLGTVMDLADNEYNGTSSWDFTIAPFVDSISPLLSSVTPAEGTSAAKDTNVIIEFDEAIAANTAGLLELKNSDTDTAVPGTTTVTGNTLVFVPGSDLLYDGNYRMSLLGSVTDLAGNEHNATTTSWDFSILPFSDTNAPIFQSVTPADGSIASISTEIIMAFDETIADDGVTLGLKDSDTDTVILGTPIVSGSTLSFAPDDNLTKGGNYTVTLIGTVHDLAGNAYDDSTTSWDFSANTFSVVSAQRDNYSSSPNNVILEFSSALDPLTVGSSDFEVKLGSIPLQNQEMTNFDVSGNIVTFTVQLAIPTSTFYSVIVSGSIKDVDGISHNNGVADTYRFSDYTD